MESNPFDADSIDVLIVELGDIALNSVADVQQVWDELESIAEDFPGYVPVFHLNSTWHGTG